LDEIVTGLEATDTFWQFKRLVYI